MKKLGKVITTAILASTLVACSSETKKQDANTIKVVATANPHAVILEEVKKELSKEGITLEIIETDDYYMPNEAVSSNDADANFFQHRPFFEKECLNNGYELSELCAVHLEPFGFYSKEIDDINALKDGATIVISNSVADNGRILKMLEDANLLTLKDGVDAVNATLNDIEENKKNLNFEEVKPELLVTAYENGEGDLVAINGNYAIQGNLVPSKDAVLLEEGNETNPYVNIVAIRKGDENASLQKLKEVLKSEHMQQFIEDTWNDGSVIYVK